MIRFAHMFCMEHLIIRRIERDVAKMCFDLCVKSSLVSDLH